MQLKHYGIVTAGCLLLGGCAHQAGQPGGSNSRHSLDEDRQPFSQSQADDCNAVGPNAGETADGQTLAVTDCDLMAVRRAVEAEQRELDADWPDEDMGGQSGPLSGGIPRLPTSSGPELLGGQ